MDLHEGDVNKARCGKVAHEGANRLKRGEAFVSGSTLEVKVLDGIIVSRRFGLCWAVKEVLVGS